MQAAHHNCLCVWKPTPGKPCQAARWLFAIGSYHFYPVGKRDQASSPRLFPPQNREVSCVWTMNGPPAEARRPVRVMDARGHRKVHGLPLSGSLGPAKMKGFPRHLPLLGLQGSQIHVPFIGWIQTPGSRLTVITGQSRSAHWRVHPLLSLLDIAPS